MKKNKPIQTRIIPFSEITFKINVTLVSVGQEIFLDFVDISS